jgi:hypothetical protein
MRNLTSVGDYSNVNSDEDVFTEPSIIEVPVYSQLLDEVNVCLD